MNASSLEFFHWYKSKHSTGWTIEGVFCSHQHCHDSNVNPKSLSHVTVSDDIELPIFPYFLHMPRFPSSICKWYIHMTEHYSISISNFPFPFPFPFLNAMAVSKTHLNNAHQNSSFGGIFDRQKTHKKTQIIAFCMLNSQLNCIFRFYPYPHLFRPHILRCSFISSHSSQKLGNIAQIFVSHFCYFLV